MTLNTHNRVRARLLIDLFPGIHLRELQRSLHVSFSSARYHVDALSKSGEIERSDDAGYSRLYPLGVTEDEKVLFVSTRNRANRSILSILIKTPNLTNKHLSKRSGLAKSTVSEHIQTLLDSGIIRENRSTNAGTTYSVVNPNSVSRALARNNPNILNEAAERFIDLWEI